MAESQTDDLIALNQLAFRYAHAIDTCDDVLLNQVFTSDGRMRVYHPGEDAPFIDLSGPEELASVPRTMKPAHLRTMHQMTNHIVELEGDSANGQVYCCARHLALDAKSVLNVLIRYEDRYRRIDGKWRIADRKIRFLWDEVHPAGSAAFEGEEPIR
jgi:SnoaL-like domain